MKSITRPASIRSAPTAVAPTVRNVTPPPVFVDVDRLHEAVRGLIRTRTTMIEACDQADVAAYAAGTPIRTQGFRAHIDAVTTEIQRIESKVTEAAAGENTERERLAGNVTKTLAQQTTDNLAKITLDQTSAEVDKNFASTKSHAHLGLLSRLDESVHSGDRGFETGHHGGPEDEQDERRGLPSFFATAKSLTIPKVRAGTKTTFYEIPNLASSVRQLLKDGGFGTDRVTHGELKQIVELFKSADEAWLNQCILELSDKELKLIADDMDSSGFGNYDGLSSKEKEAFIANLASKLDATQFARICFAFDDPKQIGSVLARTKNCWPAKQGFLTYCNRVFDERNRAANFSAADTELAAAAQVLASVSTTQLGVVLSERADRLEFLRGVFRLAQGQMLIPSNGRLDCVYDPKLLFSINQLAIDLPTRSPERFLVFQLTVESLVSTHAAQPSAPGHEGELLAVVKLLLEPSPLAVLSDHKADPFLFTDYFVLLAHAGEMSVCTNMIVTLNGSTKAADVMMTGYIVGLIENTESALSKERNQRIELATGIAGALINAFDPSVVVAGTLALALISSVTGYLDRGTSISEAAFAATVSRFNDKPGMLQLLSTGRELARIRN
jgi:hypothetical protein